MIRVRNLYKSFDGLEILKDVSLEIPDASFFGIIGESGAGKSTLLKCFNKLIDFDSGEVEVDKFALYQLDEDGLRKLRKNMGMVFQNFGLMEQKSARQNIVLPLELWGVEKEEISHRVEELAKLVGIEDQLGKRPKELSGGQKQRVAIARALGNRPKYLLCDECTSALDPKNSVMIMELLEEIRQELAVSIVMVTHDMGIAREFSQQLAIMQSGKLLDYDDTNIMVDRYPDYFSDRKVRG